MALRLGAHLMSLHDRLLYEPLTRRVRCFLGSVPVADTTSPVLVWETRRVVPMYAVPEVDVLTALEPCAAAPAPERLPPLLGPVRVDVHLDTTRAVALHETHITTRWYVPRDDVRMDLLTPSASRTVCAYKGHARYWSLEEAGPDGKDLAWSYEDPLHDALPVRGMICFYAERTDLTLDGEEVPRATSPWASPADQARF
jgi:uncharacterized protein (DUF427 family)